MDQVDFPAPKKAGRGQYPCNLFKVSNLAIGMCYFTVGAVSSLQLTPTNLYLVQILDASPSDQTTIVILLQVPWALKLLFGFLSDAQPIFGMHRKPYLVMGMLLYSSMYLAYGWSRVDDFRMLCSCLFTATIGLIQMDVMADTMVVERSKFEDEANRGQLQATCYSMRFAGGVLGALMAIALTSHAHVKHEGFVRLLEGESGLDFSRHMRRHRHASASFHRSFAPATR